jgi:exodeoxyribonuclease-3
MKIVSLNIRHGGGKRLPKILDWLAHAEADFILLCEWRFNPSGVAIERSLQSEGYLTSGYARGCNENGVLVASKQSHTASRITPTGADKGEMIKVKCGRTILICSYFPQKNAKKPFFEVAHEQLASSEGPAMLLGDLNTGSNEIDLEEGAIRFFCAGEFMELQTRAGTQDLWRLCHGESAKEWSWHSGKNGFRIDHALGNQSITTAFPNLSCWYDHSTRSEGISDHSALLIDLGAENLSAAPAPK